MSKNYMKEIAQLLGVELGEEFKLKEIKGCTFKFIEDSFVVKNDNDNEDEWFTSLFIVDVLNGSAIIEKSILDQKEKEYLSAVIKPFKDRVFGIVKHKQYINIYEYIAISIKEETGDHFHASLPSFKAGTMYKGMEVGRLYSLEELGL